MIKKIDSLLYSLSPILHQKAKYYFNRVKKRFHSKIDESEFIDLLTKRMSLSKGDTIFVHSSMRSLYLNFEKDKIFEILSQIVGPEGTLLFPCWQFNTRAEDYIKENKIVFDIRNSPSAMGKISDVLRKNPNAKRSFHPTNSVIAIGPNAIDLTENHHEDIYPCGHSSPFYKMLKYDAKIIGLGVTVDNLTFVHTIEDIMKEKFPLSTRLGEIFSCTCVDSNGNQKEIHTLVASHAIQNRNVYGFFNMHIKHSDYISVRLKGMDFFKVNSKKLFEEMSNLAGQDITIYKY